MTSRPLQLPIARMEFLSPCRLAGIGWEENRGERRFLAGANATHIAEFSSPGPGNKARHAGLHHGVEPDARRDAVPNFPHGVFRQGRKLEVLQDAVGRD